jgi:hypothetical protein
VRPGSVDNNNVHSMGVEEVALKTRPTQIRDCKQPRTTTKDGGLEEPGRALHLKLGLLCRYWQPHALRFAAEVASHAAWLMTGYIAESAQKNDAAKLYPGSLPCATIRVRAAQRDDAPYRSQKPLTAVVRHRSATVDKHVQRHECY